LDGDDEGKGDGDSKGTAPLSRTSFEREFDHKFRLSLNPFPGEAALTQG
jgi:hypothetical protein